MGQETVLVIASHGKMKILIMILGGSLNERNALFR